MESESNILNGLNDHLQGGNVVISDLNFNPCVGNYKFREREGLNVRVVKNRDWQIDMEAMRQAVDGNTRLISVALVSNINGYLADMTTLSKLAHDHGAYLYVDIMQAAGCVPIDVKAMGIDFAACSTFKWLMGVKGFWVSVRGLRSAGNRAQTIPAHRRGFVSLSALERAFQPGRGRALVFHRRPESARTRSATPRTKESSAPGKRQIHSESGGR